MVAHWYQGVQDFLDRPLVIIIPGTPEATRKELERRLAGLGGPSSKPQVVYPGEELRQAEESEARRLSLLLRYTFSRLERIETGGIMGLDITGLANYMGLELGHPRTLRDELYREFGSWAETADRVLTGDVYEDGEDGG